MSTAHRAAALDVDAELDAETVQSPGASDPATDAPTPADSSGDRCLIRVPESLELTRVLAVLEHGEVPVLHTFEARHLVSARDVDATTRARLETLGAEIVEDAAFRPEPRERLDDG